MLNEWVANAVEGNSIVHGGRNGEDGSADAA